MLKKIFARNKDIKLKQGFTNNYWLIQSDNKQIQCVIPVTNRKMSVITSTLDF